MEKEFIKKVHTVMLPPRRVYEDEQEGVIRLMCENKKMLPWLDFSHLQGYKVIEVLTNGKRID
jgi:hypothetical protein